MYPQIPGIAGSPVKNSNTRISSRHRERKRAYPKEVELNTTDKSGRTLVACRIFEEELHAVLDTESRLEDIQIVWVDSGLHCDLNRLEEALAKAIATARTAGRDVRMLFGRGCHPEIDSLAGKCAIRTTPVKNCIEAFLGEKAKKLEEDRTMVMTPTWIRTWPHSVRTFLGWNEVDIRMNMGRYDRILVADPGLNPLTDEEILDFFDLVQVPVEVMSLDLGLFRETVARLLE